MGIKEWAASLECRCILRYNPDARFQIMKRTLWLLPLVSVSLFCQTERGNITGQIKDTTGAAIPHADVTAIHLSTSQQAKAQSTSSGDYNISVTPGAYKIV